MPNPIMELSKLTCRAKQIDGMGFGGTTSDNLEVAAILGMCNPNTNKKLYLKAYRFARFAYCDDIQYRGYVTASLLNILVMKGTGKLSEGVLLKLAQTALHEFKHPATKINKSGEQEVESYSVRKLAKLVGVHHSNMKNKHKDLYSLLVEQLNIWSSDAYQHIKSHYDYDAE